MRKKLTKTVVDGLAPGASDYCIWDTELEGFGVRVQPTGRKVYMIRYRTKDAARTQRKMNIALTSVMPPDKARDMARKRFAEVADGSDPVADRKPKQASTATVARMFQAYVDNMKSKGRESAMEVERVLLKAKRNAADHFGRDRAASSITPSDVVGFVSLFYDDGFPGAADKARSYISSAYTWAITSANDYTVKHRQDWSVTTNPAAAVAKDSNASKPRERNLSALEVHKLWLATDDPACGFGLEVACCVKLLLCTGQRVQETLRLDGSEIDLEKGLWFMPVHKTKTKVKPHVVPLPEQAIPVLRQLIEIHGSGPLFPGRLEGDNGRLRYKSVGKAISRWLEAFEPKIPHFTTRDIRRTWKSRAHDAGIDRFTRDLIQQHAKSDTGSKHYDHSDYLPQKQEAMVKWSKWLAATIDPSQKVVSIAA